MAIRMLLPSSSLSDTTTFGVHRSIPMSARLFLLDLVRFGLKSQRLIRS